ncbi:MAG TPA: LON peptidase substrate-binding domain-containing protein [Terriglobales bacterium]|nr:LON peptidase substrate-binding domain-containing protein [Terriglobales bacterium]
MSDLLPLFPLDLVLFPETPLPLHIFESRYKEMIGECLRDKTEFGMVRSNGPRLAEVGCTAQIIELLRTYPDGRMDVLTMGRRRFSVTAVNDDRSFLRGQVDFFEDEAAPNASEELRQSALSLHSEMTTLISADALRLDEESNFLSFQMAAHLPVDLDFKQTLLQMRSERERLQVLLDYYTRIIPKLQAMMFGKKKSGGNGWIH